MVTIVVQGPVDSDDPSFDVMLSNSSQVQETVTLTMSVGGVPRSFSWGGSVPAPQHTVALSAGEILVGQISNWGTGIPGDEVVLSAGGASSTTQMLAGFGTPQKRRRRS